MNDFLIQIKEIIVSPEVQDALFPLKIVFILFGLLFFVAFIYFYKKSSFARAYFFEDWDEFISFQSYETKDIKTRWEIIQQRLKTPYEADWKLSILEAEELLNECLEKSGYPGKDLQERLSKVDREIIPFPELVLEANKIYERIIEDPDYSLKLAEAQEFFETVENILKKLGKI